MWKAQDCSNRKVGLEILLPVEFKLWVKKCKYFERMKEIVQLSIKRQLWNFLKLVTKDS